MPISSFPPAPSRSDPTTFADKADAYLAHLESPFVAQANALESNVNAKEASAVAASNAAVAVANAPLWVSGTTYALGFAVYDPNDFLTYRRAIAGAGTTRPGLDGSNWVRVVGTGNARTDQSQTFTGVNTFSQPIGGSGANLTSLNASALASGTVPAARLPTATETAIGALEIATAAEAQAGTSDALTITPLKLREGLNASGTAPIYACRAWVNFNGTGTPAIRASGNVSSITDNGVGGYTVNFTTAMPDVNYTITGTCEATTNHPARCVSLANGATPGASSVRLTTGLPGANTVIGRLDDCAYVYVAIFR